MDVTALKYWALENQPLINFGLLVGTVLSALAAVWTSLVSIRQLQTAIRPAMTLEALRGGGVCLRNSGNGTAVNMVAVVLVHTGVKYWPTFTMRKFECVKAIVAGEDLKIIEPLTPAFQSTTESDG